MLPTSTRPPSQDSIALVTLADIRLFLPQIIGDVTSLRWRSLISSCVSIPFFINAFVASNIGVSEGVQSVSHSERELTSRSNRPTSTLEEDGVGDTGEFLRVIRRHRTTANTLLSDRRMCEPASIAATSAQCPMLPLLTDTTFYSLHHHTCWMRSYHRYPLLGPAPREESWCRRHQLRKWHRCRHRGRHSPSRKEDHWTHH